MARKKEMKPKKPVCKICGKSTEGRGHYSFRYLDETIYLCGHHAQEVMHLIKNRSKTYDKEE